MAYRCVKSTIARYAPRQNAAGPQATLRAPEGSRNAKKPPVTGGRVELFWRSPIRGNWSGRRDSNPRPRPWQGRALPLSYTRIREVSGATRLTFSADRRGRSYNRNAGPLATRPSAPVTIPMRRRIQARDGARKTRIWLAKTPVSGDDVGPALLHCPVAAVPLKDALADVNHRAPGAIAISPGRRRTECRNGGQSGSGQQNS
jgi:hypothetical protein